MSEILTTLQTALSDRYAISREIGAEGMATVYLGRDLKHDRGVAIKVLRPELAVLRVERFLAEIKVIVPPHVDAGVRHALEKLAADRFPTAGEFASALQGKGDWLALARYGPAAGTVAGREMADLSDLAPRFPPQRHFRSTTHGDSTTSAAGHRPRYRTNAAVSPAGNWLVYESDESPCPQAARRRDRLRPQPHRQGAERKPRLFRGFATNLDHQRLPPSSEVRWAGTPRCRW